MSVSRATAVDVLPEDFSGPVAAPLLAELDVELERRYRDESDIPPPPYDPEDYRPPRGVFLVARLDGQPVGCGAVRPGPFEGTGEVKRMYVAQSARGRGIARALLTALREAAADLGYRALVLETGVRQPEAMALYASDGWTPIDNYGHYRESPLSRCFRRELP